MSETGTIPDDAVDDLIPRGRAALERHEWQAAFDAFSAADAIRPLDGPGLEALAQAAFFVARADVDAEARERAFKAYEAAGQRERAAYVAIDLARMYGYEGKGAIASVWVKRAERLVSPDDEGYIRGYLAVVYSEGARASGDMDRALEFAEQAIAISERAKDADLRAHALTNLGELKIIGGSPSDGMALMEEATLSAVNGELTPFASGVTACRTISACRDLTDYQRATEWIEATERYCERQALSGFPGVCRVHRAELAAVGGAWDGAEEELKRATVELEHYRATQPLADGYYAIGDIRRLKGDFDGAEAALREAHERGRTPQPALALIRLAQGNTRAAATSIESALTEAADDRLARLRLLPAAIEISLAGGDTGAARRAVDEFESLVAAYPSPALEAMRHCALGKVLLAEGDAQAAVRELRLTVKLWRGISAPYETARGRFALSRALRSVGDDEDADLELRAATEEFERLGARPDAVIAEREARDVETRRSGPVSTRMTFMFTDIVGSTNLAEALGDAAWERLLRWHDDTLRSLISRHAGEVVKSTGDGFFAAFASATSGIEAAMAIQRALRDRGEASGFSLPVRIGLHTADANRRGGDDYSGTGVHVAARVAAQAGGGQILASTETVTEASDIVSGRAGPPVATALKGVSKPVDLVEISWP